jgi:hypothetical protein
VSMGRGHHDVLGLQAELLVGAVSCLMPQSWHFDA